MKLWKNFAVYAGVGYQFFEDPNAFEELVWTAGASYYWKSMTLMTAIGTLTFQPTNVSLEADLATAAMRASLGLFPSIPHGRHCSHGRRINNPSS